MCGASSAEPTRSPVFSISSSVLLRSEPAGKTGVSVLFVAESRR